MQIGLQLPCNCFLQIRLNVDLNNSLSWGNFGREQVSTNAFTRRVVIDFHVFRWTSACRENFPYLQTRELFGLLMYLPVAPCHVKLAYLLFSKFDRVQIFILVLIIHYFGLWWEEEFTMMNVDHNGGLVIFHFSASNLE